MYLDNLVNRTRTMVSRAHTSTHVGCSFPPCGDRQSGHGHNRGLPANYQGMMNAPLRREIVHYNQSVEVF